MTDKRKLPQSIPAPAAPELQRKPTDGNDNGQRILQAGGYVAAQRIAIVSAEITGRIFEVNVEEGTAVQEGQVVMRAYCRIWASRLRSLDRTVSQRSWSHDGNHLV